MRRPAHADANAQGLRQADRPRTGAECTKPDSAALLCGALPACRLAEAAAKHADGGRPRREECGRAPDLLPRAKKVVRS